MKSISHSDEPDVNRVPRVLKFSCAETVEESPAIVGRVTAATKSRLYVETRGALLRGSQVRAVGQIEADEGLLAIEGRFQVMDCVPTGPGRFMICLTFEEVVSGSIRSVNLLAVLEAPTAGRHPASRSPKAAPPPQTSGSTLNGIVVIRGTRPSSPRARRVPARETESLNAA